MPEFRFSPEFVEALERMRNTLQNANTMANPGDDMNSTPEPTRSRVLGEANKLINGDRQAQYGPPDENFKNIADFWNTRFKHKLAAGSEFTPSDVAIAMVFLKLGRDMQGYKEDTAIDGAGYLALYAEMAENEAMKEK